MAQSRTVFTAANASGDPETLIFFLLAEPLAAL
jgi:hypothetical protein